MNIGACSDLPAPPRPVDEWLLSAVHEARPGSPECSLGQEIMAHRLLKLQLATTIRAAGHQADLLRFGDYTIDQLHTPSPAYDPTLDAAPEKAGGRTAAQQ
jgi:hypothetical protein